MVSYLGALSPRVVSKRVASSQGGLRESGLSPGWSLTMVGLSSGWSQTRVVSHYVGPSPRLVSHQDGLSPRLVSHQDSFKPWWSLDQDGLQSPGWSRITRVVSQQGFQCTDFQAGYVGFWPGPPFCSRPQLPPPPTPFFFTSPFACTCP